MSSNNRRALGLTIVPILIAALLAWAGSQGGVLWKGIPVFVCCVLLAFVVQWLAYIPAFIAQTERYYDLTGSLTYLSLVGIAVLLAPVTDVRVLILAAMVAMWALRLGVFLFSRIIKDGSDSRFDDIKPHALRFFSVWTLQGLWVSVTMAAALAAMTSDVSRPLSLTGYIGIFLWVIGFGIEVIADYQKRKFRAQLAGEKRFITSGLWAYSRHPNYFGEITLWVGVSLIALPVLEGWQYVTLISPVFVALLLIRVSGVPLLEASSDKHFGGDKAYEYYKASTPVLIPRLTRPTAFEDSQYE